jgi:hypothetical protein
MISSGLYTARQLTRHRQHRQYRPGVQAGGGYFGRAKRRVQTMLTVLTQKPPFPVIISFGGR